MNVFTGHKLWAFAEGYIPVDTQLNGRKAKNPFIVTNDKPELVCILPLTYGIIML